MSATREVSTSELDPSSFPAQDDLKRAFLHMSFAQYDEAIAACERAADHAPEHPLPAALKGSFELAAGRVRKALGTLRRTTKQHPGDALSHIYFAEACFLAGRHRQGRRALARAEALIEAEGRDVEHGVDLTELISNVGQVWGEIDMSELPPPVVAEFDAPSQT